MGIEHTKLSRRDPAASQGIVLGREIPVKDAAAHIGVAPVVILRGVVAGEIDGRTDAHSGYVVNIASLEQWAKTRAERRAERTLDAASNAAGQQANEPPPTEEPLVRINGLMQPMIATPPREDPRRKGRRR